MASDKWFEDKQKLTAQFVKANKTAVGIRQLWEGLLDSCFHYFIPMQNRFYRPKEQQGEQKNARIYDTTGVEATQTFVSKMHNSMTPPQVQWGFLELATEEAEAGDEKAIQEYQRVLDVYMRRLFHYIHISNFDVIINECYFDQAIGTSCIVANYGTDKEPLIFDSIPLNNLSILESATGRVHSWFRKWEDILISEIKVKWRKAELTPEMKRKMEDDPSAKVSCVHEGVLHIPGEAKPFIYCVVYENNLLFSEPLESNPGIVWRFQKTNGETWGRGPCMNALPSMASLNEIAKIELASANLNTFRPYMGFSDAVFNPHTFKLKPFTVIPIAPLAAGANPPLMPLPDSSNPQFAQLMIQDLRNQVKHLLFNEASDSPTIQPDSATEVMRNQQDLAQKIGPLFARLQQEFLWPLIERCAYILDKTGILQKPKIDNRYIKFEYKSPLAASQGLQEVQKVQQLISVAQGIWGPEIASMYINPKTAIYKIADYLQVDPTLLQPIDKVEETVREANEARQQEQEAIAESEAPPPESVQG